MTERVLPAPAITPEAKAFWDGTERGEFLVKSCESCSKSHFYPRPHCPHCMSDKTTWKKVSGKGKIYSYSVMRRAPEPFAIAYVTLEEGLTVLTNLVDCDLDRIKIGQNVQVAFAQSKDGPLVPVFRPV